MPEPHETLHIGHPSDLVLESHCGSLQFLFLFQAGKLGRGQSPLRACLFAPKYGQLALSLPTSNGSLKRYGYTLSC